MPVLNDHILLLFSLSIMSNSCDPVDIARQAPLSMEFSRQATGVGCHFLLQRIFPTQGLNLHLLLWQEPHITTTS